MRVPLLLRWWTRCLPAARGAGRAAIYCWRAGAQRCYRHFMTVPHDDDMQTGVPLASTAVSSWAGTSASAAHERYGRKRRPEVKSHTSLRISVAPARNVV